MDNGSRVNREVYARFCERLKVRVLGSTHHRNGFCLWYKRLEREKFAWPIDVQGPTQTVTMQEFEWLIEGFDLWRNRPHKSLYFESVS